MVSPFVRRRRLASELVGIRDLHGYSSERLAKVVGISRTNLSRLENGHVRPDLDDVRRILDVLEVAEPRRTIIMTIARDGQERGWWEKYADEMGPRQALYANLEAGAAVIHEYQMTIIPGLLQIPEFTETRAQADRKAYPANFDPVRALEARAERQRVLLRPDPPEYHVIIDELAIRRFAAPPPIVGAQLDHLAMVGHQLENVTIRILPLNAYIREHALPRSAFYSYHYPDPDDPIVVAVDTVTSDLVLTRSPEVDHYLNLYELLTAAALTPADSLDFLVREAEALSHKTRILT